MQLPKQYNIKWKRADYIRLGKAVSDFNKKINRLQSEEKKLYLPEVLEYKNVKSNISTRSELNRIIRSLQRFKKAGSEEIYQTESGEQITKWERKELGIQKRTAVKRLKRELTSLNVPISDGFSRAQMGSERLREIKAELQSLSNLEKRKGYQFERLKRRIEFLGTSDYTLKKAYIFRQNFMEELNNLQKNSPEFRRIYDYFLDIKNPIEFFNVTQRSNVLQDFFVWYITPENYAGFDGKQDIANYIITEYKLY